MVKTYHNKNKIETKEETIIYNLNPGEEAQLNCEKVFDKNNPSYWIKFDYQIVGRIYN